MLRRGLKVWMEATLVHGPFHGDVRGQHLGARRRARRLPRLRHHGRAARGPPPALRGAQYTVMIDGDYTRIVRAWQSIGILSDDVGPIDEVAARLRGGARPHVRHDPRRGEPVVRAARQLELQHEYGARAARELVLVSKQLMYFERYAKELAPDYNMARDLFLVQNVFPEPVARLAAETASPSRTTRSPTCWGQATPGRPCDDSARGSGPAWTTISSWTAQVSAT